MKPKKWQTRSVIRNYFADLELDHTATIQEIRSAYRRLAKKFHPDAHPNDTIAEESFRRIQEAYEHLNTVTKVSRLKSRLSNIKALETSAITRWKDQKRPSPEVDDLRQTLRSRKEEDLDIHFSLAVQERVIDHGGKERFQFVFEKPCPTCKGRGGSKNSVYATCKKCAGLGSYQIARGALQWKKTCEDCFGKGKNVVVPCAGCSGKGKVAERQAVEVKIPAAVDLHQKVCLKGLGHISFDGAKRGDLWLSLTRKA